MGQHGKLGARQRKHKARLTEFGQGINFILKHLSQKIKVMPLLDGRVACVLGDNTVGEIKFIIEQNTILTAAESGIKLAENLKAKHDGTETGTLPAGG